MAIELERRIEELEIEILAQYVVIRDLISILAKSLPDEMRHFLAQKQADVDRFPRTDVREVAKERDALIRCRNIVESGLIEFQKAESP